jgi:hypothetical protein
MVWTWVGRRHGRRCPHAVTRAHVILEHLLKHSCTKWPDAVYITQSSHFFLFLSQPEKQRKVDQVLQGMQLLKKDSTGRFSSRSKTRPIGIMASILRDAHRGRSRWAAVRHARLGSSSNSTFSAPSELLAATRTGGSQATFSKPAALRGLDIAFGLTITNPSGVRSTPGTTGR